MLEYLEVEEIPELKKVYNEIGLIEMSESKEVPDQKISLQSHLRMQFVFYHILD